jgi:hypothetical protein
MTFFNWSSGSTSGNPSFHVSKWIWIYVAITVPLTSAIYLSWKLWIKGRGEAKADTKHQRLLRDLEQGLAGPESPSGHNAFSGLRYWDPASQPLDLGDGKLEEDTKMQPSHGMEDGIALTSLRYGH